MHKFLLIAALASFLPIRDAVAFSGYYEIVNRNSGMVLDVAGYSTTNGGNVDQWGGNGGYNQQWTLTDVGGGFSKIINRYSGLALEVSGSSTVSGGNVDQWLYGGGSNQQWTVSSIGNGSYQIINGNSGLSLEVAGQSTGDGGNVDQSTWTGGNSQQWLILPVGATTTISPSSGGSGAPSKTFHGFNWADPRDNFIEGPLLLAGLNFTNDYATVQSTAGVLLGAFQGVGANTVRIPINPETVIGTWWANYKGAIDEATGRGMRVILCPWCHTNSNDGVVDDPTTFWQMWDTVVTNYNGNGNVYFEVLNEPYGYDTADWLNVVSNWVQRYPTVAHGRIFVESPDGDIPSVASSGITSGCLLSVHIYGYFTAPNDTNDADFYNYLSDDVGAYAGRTVMTEFGAVMAAGYNYAEGDQANNNIASMIGFCNYCCSNQMGSVYWYGPGLNDGNIYAYGMFTVNSNTLATSLNSPSGMALVKYGWSYFNGVGTYQIVNGNSGLAMEVVGSSTANGGNVDQSSYTNGSNQQWILSNLGNGYDKIINVNSGLALEVAGSSIANGGNVDQRTYTGGYNQQWGILNLRTGFYEITNRYSGLALEVNGWSLLNGGNVDQWTYGGGANQLWTFAPYEANPLTVNPPSFTPSNITLIGATLTATATASGTTPLFYQWQTDGGSGGTLTNIPGATNASFVLNTTGLPVGPDQFDVIVTNGSEIVTSAVASLTIVYATASAILTDVGGSISPGPYDISQFVTGGSAYYGDGLNYYTDGGVNYGFYPGQTFTTGTNAAGYNLSSVAIDTGGPNGNLTSTPQPYDLFLYSITGGNATLVAHYTATNFAFAFGDWLQWSGFSVPLKANTAYAYAFGLDASLANSYCALNTSPTNTDQYAGGQICLIASGGGALTFGTSGKSDAVFDLGLSPIVQTVTLGIQNIGGGQFQLQWTSGVLLQATNLAGPWTTNAAASPYMVTPTAPQMFYRAKGL